MSPVNTAVDPNAGPPALLMDGMITIDPRGIARLSGSRIRVVDIAMDMNVQGWSPQQIQEQHSHLSLAQIHAALAYYYAHQAELDRKIEDDFRKAEEMRLAAGESPVAKKLRAQGLIP